MLFMIILCVSYIFLTAERKVHYYGNMNKQPGPVCGFWLVMVRFQKKITARRYNEKICMRTLWLCI